MKTVLIVLTMTLAVHCTWVCAQDQPGTVNAMLGYPPDARLLIINADDFGMSHNTNLAVFDAFERGVLTSATVMMPTAWVKEVADWVRAHPQANVGIHLTHTSEWRNYKWGPVAGREKVPGLVSPDGYMWPDCEPAWEHATPEEAEIESRAQIELAKKMGIDPTHIDSHMGTMQLNPAFADVYLKLSQEYRLPQRQASAEMYALFGAPDRKKREREAGVLGPDVLIHGVPLPPDPADLAEAYNNILRNLKPGLTEFYLHPAIDGPEMQSISGSHARRHADYEWLINPATRALIDELGIKLISYRDLRDAMRGGQG
ncbi:MAG: ChbG/HpnK family deacetylase [Armatimonadetes bacterium]|nr:ChbG/HpnK family deacetylase [Armatimonadota bacterium]